MIFGSVCSGIEAASVAWEPLGWRCGYVAEIEPFPSAVLAHRFGAGRPEHMPSPDEVGLDEDSAKARRGAIKALDRVRWGTALHNYGDFTKVEPERTPVDLLVGGTPCQAFSFAGLRQSLADERGNLTLQFVRLVHATKSLRWAVWENVPGVLSTADNAFGCFLAGLVGGHGPLSVPGGGRWPDAGMVSGPFGRAAWRILDAQHFGVAQRRRRVFLVFCPRAAGGDPAAILFERKSGRRYRAASEGARQDVTGTLSARSSGGGGLGTDLECAGGLVPTVTHTLRAEGFDASEDGTGRGTPIVPVAIPILEAGARTGKSATDPRAGMGVGSNGDPMFTLQASKQHAVALAENQRGELRVSDVAGALNRGGGKPGQGYPAAMQGNAVRRLMPVECERLQGFPDGHTMIEWRGKDAPDGPRLKALGNSMAVPVMHWIGSRIQAFEDGVLDKHEWAPPAWVQRFIGNPGTAATAFALRGRDGGAQVEVEGNKAGALRASNGGSSRSYIAQGGGQ